MTWFFLLISLSSTLFISSQADLISDVCSKSVNPSLCESSIRSDPRSSGRPSLQTVGLIAVDQSILATNKAIEVAKTFANGPDKQKALNCIDYDNSAIEILKQVGGVIKSGGGHGSPNLATNVNTAFSDIALCDSQYGRFEPNQLRLASTAAQALVNVIAVVVNLL